MTESYISTKRPRKNTTDRITVEALSYYVPYFRMGDDAAEKLIEDADTLSPAEINALETQAKMKDLVVEKIMSLSGPLITSEINKIIAGSHLPYSDDLFDILYYSGMGGLVKGLRHFKESKLKNSATNYLFQWFTVYAKRELSILEAPYGIAPSRFQKYKKVSAVRKKLTAELNRDVTNDEIYEYFQSGQADLKTMNGRIENSAKPSQANKNITMELIVEQEEFENNFMITELLDPLADYSSNLKLSQDAEEPFSQTVFGVFIESSGVNTTAKAVLLSELGTNQIDTESEQIVRSLTVETYKEYANAWKALIKDPNGPFYTFLKSNSAAAFGQFDINSVVRSIESYSRGSARKYKVLFKNERG